MDDMMKVNHSYTADDIQVLEGLEAVRKRPGMYIGTTSPKGLHHLLWEIVDNAIDESLAGFADKITVILEPGDSVIVKITGAVFLSRNKKTGKSRNHLSVLHAGIWRQVPIRSGGLHRRWLRSHMDVEIKTNRFLEDRSVGLETDDGSGLIGGADGLQIVDHLAAVFKAHVVDLIVFVYLDFEPFAKALTTEPPTP